MKTLLLIGLVWFAWPAFALVVSQESIDRQLSSAVLVAEVEIQSRQTENHPTLARLTTSRAKIMQLVESHDDGGEFPQIGDSIDIRSAGGEFEGTGVFLSGMPKLYVGQRYQVHLKRVAGSLFETVGFESGVQALSPTRAYSRNRTDGSNGDGSGPFLYWDPRFFPIPYYLSAPTFKNLTNFAAAVDASLQAWSAPGDVKISFLAVGCSTVLRNANDGLNNIVLVTDTWPFDPDAIAITRNFYVADDSNKAGLILDSDILLNGVNHDFTTTNESGKHDVQNIVTHEAGHFIGLGHEQTPLDNQATMYAVASPNETNKRTLKSDDLAGLHAAYGGVAIKMQTTRTMDNCTLTSSANVGCASVHNRAANPGAWIWLLATVFTITLVGRTLICREAGTLHPRHCEEAKPNVATRGRTH